MIRFGAHVLNLDRSFIMLTVYKYPLPIDDIVTIEIPKGAKILFIAEQNGDPFIWALVDPNNEKEQRVFRFAGTGHKILTHHVGEFVGTFFASGGLFVWHIFETCESVSNRWPKQ